MINLANGQSTNTQIVEFVLQTVFFNHLFCADDEFIDLVTDDVKSALEILIPGWSIEVVIEADTSISKVEADVTLWTDDPNDAINISASLVWDPA